MITQVLRSLTVRSASLLGAYALLLAIAWAAPAGADTPGQPLSMEQWDQVAALHDAGLRQDQAALPQFLQALRHEHHAFRRVALWGLGRLENPQARPALQAMAEDPKTAAEERPYALAVAARINAAAGGRAPDLATLGQQMRAVLDGVGLTAAQVQDAVGVVAEEEGRPVPAARAVLRQIADMAMAAADRGLTHGAQAAPVAVAHLPAYAWRGGTAGHSPGSYFPLLAYGLKMTLSALPSREARIHYLVTELSTRKVLGMPDDFLMQALANEGQAAVPLMVAQLETMRKDRGNYTHATFAGFFRALKVIGGPDAAAEVKSFHDDPDGWVRYYSDQAWEFLGTGHRSLRVCDY